MQRCDVCNKPTILPEILGSATVCKPCVLKINGVFWKFIKAKNGTDLNKMRAKALESATKANYPEKVINGINEYFDKEASNMLMCSVCGETVVEYKKIESSLLCNKCFKKIDIYEFNRRDFEDRTQLAECEKKVIDKATKAKFPESVIASIQKNFSKKVSEDWLYTYSNLEGHKIKVYKNYASIITTEDFDMEEVKKKFYSLMSNQKEISALGEFGKGMISDLTRLKNPLTMKNMMKNISKAAISSQNSSINEKDSPLKFKCIRGNQKVLYSDYDYVDLIRSKNDDGIGFIYFGNSKDDRKYSLFFFDNSYVSKVKEIRKVLSQMIEESNKEKELERKQNEVHNEMSDFDKLRELKSLLDEGIITEEEFNLKKKEILKL